MNAANSELLLPIISNQNLNKYLKEIGEITGIKKRLSMHLGRHTFATTITLNKGVDIVSVSKMLGHKNLKVTQVYAKTSMLKISDDMKRFFSNDN
jgi:site-specific recombinase XerD